MERRGENKLKRNNWKIVLVLIIFVAVLLKISSSSGTDISASYMSCRLLRVGAVSHLYANDPASFNSVPDPTWRRIADSSGVSRSVLLTPFVQTPLWPYVLEPLCGSLSFVAFNYFFKFIMAGCFASLIWFTGRYWTTRFFNPIWVSLICVLWVRADPLRQAMELTQTHAIFVLLVLLAILLTSRNYAISGGILLAIAAAVKITPGVLFIYWLLTGYRKAAWSFLIASAALFALTPLAVGRAATMAYVASMSRVSNVLLVSEGNQSFAAWWMGRFYSHSDTLVLRTLHLPLVLKIVCLILVVCSALIGAYMDSSSRINPIANQPLYGAVFAFVGGTLFTPIAWSHYYLILVVPLILLLDEQLRKGSYVVLGLFGLIVAFTNAPNLLRHAGYLHIPVPNLVRGQFYAGLIAMAALVLLHLRRRSTSPLNE